MLNKKKSGSLSFADKVKADLAAAKRKVEDLAKKTVGKVERKKEDKKT